MRKKEIIAAIEQSFEGMQKRNERTIIVRFWDGTREITLVSGGILQVSFVKILLSRKSDNKILILYKNETYEELPFVTIEEKKNAIEFLQFNKILPTPQEFLEACSLSNTPGAAALFGCDFSR